MDIMEWNWDKKTMKNGLHNVWLFFALLLLYEVGRWFVKMALAHISTATVLLSMPLSSHFDAYQRLVD